MLNKKQQVAKNQAMHWFREASEENNAMAQYNLGKCYYEGLGVAKDYSKAVRWFTLSAKQGNACGQCALAEMYYLGHGVEADVDKAVKWFQQAAANGSDEAEINLGFISMARDIISTMLIEIGGEENAKKKAEENKLHGHENSV